MKRRVCCLLLGICMLCLPAQQVYAAPPGPVPHEHEHEHKKPVPPHEKEHEKPVPPHEHDHEHKKPVPPHEQEHPKPHEEKKGPLGEKPQPPVTVVQTTTQSAASTSTSASTLASEVVKYALQFVGNPYKYGGTSLTNGADCSGFVQSVYKHFNYSIARTSGEQAGSAGYMEVALKESELQPGDLIFYARGNGVVYHVALYIGDGKVVHAANSKAGIIISEYTYMKPYKARRIVR